MLSETVRLFASIAPIVGPITVAVLVFLLRSRTAEARVQAGQAVMEHTGLMRGLAVVFLLVPCAICLLAFVAPPKPEERWLPVYLIAGFLCLAIPIALEAYRRKLRVESDALVSESPWTGVRRIPWSEIARISYSASMSWYVIEDRGGNSVRVSAMMSGLQTLARALSERAPSATGAQATERMRSNRVL